MFQHLGRHWCTQALETGAGAPSWRDYFLEDQLQATSSLIRERHEALKSKVAEKEFIGEYHEPLFTCE